MKNPVNLTFASFAAKGLNILRKNKINRDTFPLRLVITGIEHSGTTLLSTLVKQDPKLAGGFECGFLLADRPDEFKNIHPWYEWMQESVEKKMWGISSGKLEKICSSGNWEEAYRRLVTYSPVFEQKNYQQVCDKTPRYLSCLDSVLGKIPDYVPCLVIEKEIEQLWRSHKKRNSDLTHFGEVVKKYHNGLSQALQSYGKRIYRVKYEALCTDMNNQLKQIFEFIDRPFEKKYVTNYEADTRSFYQNSRENEKPLSINELQHLNQIEKALKCD
jgi:hypothetical protein